MLQDNRNELRSVVSADRTASRESLLNKVVPIIMGFILTSVIGTMVATYFQQRGWAWQNKETRVEKDTDSALNSLHSASDLLDKRWSATFRMVQAIENAKAGDESKAVKDTFLSVNHEWELGLANVDNAVQFYVDRPFGIDNASIPKSLWSLPCTSFPFSGEKGGAVNPNSAHIILKVIDHCHELVKTDIDNLGKTLTDPNARKSLINEAYVRLDHIYHINDTLRCVILERAGEMRRSVDKDLGLVSFFQTEPKNYDLPVKEGGCVGRYREWSEKKQQK